MQLLLNVGDQEGHARRPEQEVLPEIIFYMLTVQYLSGFGELTGSWLGYT